MNFPLRALGPAAILVCEALGLLALFLTPDVSRAFLLAVVGVGTLARLLGLKISDRWLLALVAGTIFTGMGFAFLGSFAIGGVLAKSMIPLHAYLGNAANAKAFRFWRLGIGFLEIVLSAILSPETHMFVIIFAFVLMAALALSFSFLERNFELRDPAALNRPVAGAFLGAVASASFLIFLSSLLIFPLLPRSNWGGLGRSWAEPGYTEVVSFSGNALSWGAGNSRPLVWVFLPENRNWNEIVPFGLLRGKVLESFDGTEWRPGSKQISAGAEGEEGVRVEIYREPMAADILPTPYGTAQLAIAGRPRDRFVSGEWTTNTHRNRRIQYEATIAPADRSDDIPKKVHRREPEAARFSGLLRLAAQLKRGTTNDEQRIRKVMAHLQSYRARLGDVPSSGDKHPVEQFLFDTKEGHCELFATSAALLFRAMGMPSRLVAGFRGALPNGSVYSLKNTDAHAWVEVWSQEKGWVPVDPTPIVLKPTVWPDFFSDAYDHLNAYWHRYILGYEFDPRLAFRWLRQQDTRPFLLGMGVLLALWLGWRWRPRFSRRHPREKVSLAWSRLEKKASPLANFFSSAAGVPLREEYQRLRFGSREPAASEVTEFEQRGRKIIREGGGARAAEK
jgi:hypothetical protein